MGSKNVWDSIRLWENSEPTVNEFKKYLENPITTYPYDQCMQEKSRMVSVFKDAWPFEVIDQILIEDPIQYMSDNFYKFKHKKKFEQKKRIKRKKKRSKKKQNRKNRKKKN